MDIEIYTNRRRRGMTLLEVSIALMILGFGILGVAAAQLSSLRFSDKSRARSDAHYLAQQQMEAFQAMSAAAIEAIRTDPGYPNDPANPIDPDPADNFVAQFNRRWNIQPNTPEPGVYAIRVDVTWTSRESNWPQIVSLEGLKSEL
jgi:prepilin-type N-terminal cleavage/methylation domain-containing protein